MFSKAIIVSLIPAVMAFFAGTVIPFQATSNGAVGKALGHPLWGAMVSLAVSMLVLLPLLWFLKVPAPRLSHALQGPWWLWIGGVFGAVYVASAAAFAPKLGAGGFIVLVVAGQMIAAVLIDHFALMGLTPRPLTLARFAGVGLILVGAVLIQYNGTAGADPKVLASGQASA